MTKKIDEDEVEVDRIRRFLASMPGLGHTTVEKRVAQKVLLAGDGQIMARGELWEVTCKHVGVGVYRLCTKKWEPEEK